MEYSSQKKPSSVTIEKADGGFIVRHCGAEGDEIKVIKDLYSMPLVIAKIMGVEDGSMSPDAIKRKFKVDFKDGDKEDAEKQIKDKTEAKEME